MNVTPPENTVHDTTLRQDLLVFTRYHLRGWRGPVALAAAAAVPALWFGGPWLVAVGAASLLISLAPCLVMCGLGLCVMRSCKKSAEASDTTEPTAALTDTPPAEPSANGVQGGAVHARSRVPNVTGAQ